MAQQLSVPLETFRTWDSGRRAIPVPVMERARSFVADLCRKNELRPRDRPANALQVHVATELLSLDHLARELGVHQRTLRAAARTGRLQVQFSVRSVFGRPIRVATRAAGEVFKHQNYRRFGGQSLPVAPLVVVPSDYDKFLKNVRRELGLTQEALAVLIGAAGKAVVYQWESRKRTPSPVLWERVVRLQRSAGKPACRIENLSSFVCGAAAGGEDL